MEIVAGDIGGTKSLLVWASVDRERVTTRFEAEYASADFSDGHALLKRFLTDAAAPVRPVRLALALPGAVEGRSVRLTNLPWTLDADAFEAGFGFAEVRFFNDFQAAAAGVAELSDADVVTLNHGAGDRCGPRAITGAGTGLGVAYLTRDADGAWRCHASEGGHVDFAPADARQAALLAYARGEAGGGHVSWEKLVSGIGFDTLYRYCLSEAKRALPDAAVSGAEVSALAAAGDAAADAALDLFVDLYGAWAGNLALLYRPSAGLYLAGGVTRHLAERLATPRFLHAAFAKGRMRGVVEATPIHLITNKRLGLIGALAAGLEAARHRSCP